MKIVVAGGTGFVGKPLVLRLLDEGYKVVVLSRNPNAFKSHPSSELMVEWWDGRNSGAWMHHIDGAYAVVNLAGEGVADKRWSEHRKRELSDSRILSTRMLVSAIQQAQKRPEVFLNASAVGYYGNVPSGEVPESSPKGKGFLADLCADWEKAALTAADLGCRVVILRIGIVLEKGGGALAKMVPPFMMYAGGPLGTGRQYFPWVHRKDVLGAAVYALKNPSVSGVFNMTAPGVCTMADFSRALGRILGRPSWAPVPGFMLQILMGEMAGMLTGGQKAVPQRLSGAGYPFQFETAEQALADIFKK